MHNYSASVFFLCSSLPLFTKSYNGRNLCRSSLCGVTCVEPRAVEASWLDEAPDPRSYWQRREVAKVETSGGEYSQVHRRCPSSPTLFLHPTPAFSQLWCGYLCCAHFTDEESKAFRNDVTYIKSDGWGGVWIHRHHYHPALCGAIASQ